MFVLKKPDREELYMVKFSHVAAYVFIDNLAQQMSLGIANEKVASGNPI